MRFLLASLLLGAALGCGEDRLGPGADGLVGQWQAETMPLQPRGTMDRTLVILADGRSENHVITRGLDDGQRPGDLTDETTLFGRLIVSGSYFRVVPDSVVSQFWFEGASHQEVQRDFSGWPRDSTHFEIQGTQLTLEFYTYPADAPELTRQTLTRVQ